MAREGRSDVRFDFRGGVNTSFSEDVLESSELRQCKNGRLGVYGAVTKRLGSQRIHDNTIGAPSPVMGLHGRFDSASGRRVVAVANGHLYHKLLADPNFTDLAAGLSVNTRARMVQYRSGANMRLYLAVNGFYEFDGAALPTLIASAPAGVLDCCVYKGRMYVTNGSKTVYWAKRLDATKFAVADGGGFADVETYDQEPLIGLAKAGGSLLLFKDDTIARYTGVSIDDIRIDTETEGVSPDTGAIARMSIIQLPDAVAFLSAEGPYVTSESGVEPLGLKIEKEIDGLDKALWGESLMGFHKGRRELWLALPAAGAGQNDRLWVMNLRTRSWSGPWPVATSALARYERADGTDTLIRGDYGGRVREEDVGPLALDDKLRDGTGGNPVQLLVDLPELFFGDPSREKSLQKKQAIEADLGAAGSLDVTWTSERGTGTVTIPSAGAGVKDYPFKLQARGKRVRLSLTESTSAVVTINGILPEATVGRSRK